MPKLSLAEPTQQVQRKEGETELQTEFVKVYTLVNEELASLHRNVARCDNFLAALKQPSQPAKEADDLDSTDDWTFGDLAAKETIVAAVQQRVQHVDSLIAGWQRRISGLESVQLKTEVKRDETSRFMRARKDQEFAKLVRVRHLGPEHVENQQRLRRAAQGVRERMQELEEQLLLIKNRVGEAKSGRSSLRAPSLDSILRSSQNISGVAPRRLMELNHMAAELAELRPHASRLSTPARSTPGRESTPHDEPLSTLGGLEDALPAASGGPAPDVDPAQATAAYEAQRQAQAALLKARKAPILTRASTERVSEHTDLAFDEPRLRLAREPIVLQTAPASRPAPAPQAQGKAEPAEAKPAPPAQLAADAPQTPESKRAIPPGAEPSPSFLMTSTPGGKASVEPKGPSSPWTFGAMTSAFRRSAFSPQPNTAPPQYMTFEGLVPPQPAQPAPAAKQTLDEYLADRGNRDGEESDEAWEEDEVDDYPEEDDDFDEEDEDEEEEEEEDPGESDLEGDEGETDG